LARFSPFADPMRTEGPPPGVLADILGHSKVNLAMDVYDRSDEGDIAAALLPNRNLVTFGNMNKQGNLENQPN
jgi:hypothetical protein